MLRLRWLGLPILEPQRVHHVIDEFPGYVYQCRHLRWQADRVRTVVPLLVLADVGTELFPAPPHPVRDLREPRDHRGALSGLILTCHCCLHYSPNLWRLHRLSSATDP